MNKLPLSVAATAIGALAVVAGVSIQGSASAAPAPGPLYTNNLLQTTDIHDGPLGSATGGGSGSGDLQYLIDPCQQTSIRGVTDGNTFSGSWLPKSGPAHEEETVSEAYNSPQAETAARTILGWHVDNCTGDASDDLVTVGKHHRTKVAGGWSEWFSVTSTSDGYTYKTNVAVIKVGERVALLGLSAEGVTAADMTTVVTTAVTRLG